jgi:hypothetical protein
LGSSFIGNVVDVQVCLHSLPIGNPELPSHQRIPLVEHDHPDRQIAVLVPEFVVKHWWHAPLHNQRAQLLKLLLLLRENRRVMVINIPWYL